MGEQWALIYYDNVSNIAIPNNSKGLRLFRNLADGKYYVKYSDGSIELLEAYFPFNVLETTIDITGLDTIDLTGKSNYGIINLTSSNANETVIKIIGTNLNQPYTFRPQNGLIVTFQDISVAPTGNLKLSNGSLSIDGSNFGYIEMQKRTRGLNTYFFSLGYIDVYA